MAGGVTRSSEKAHIGVYSMKISATGETLETGFSNYVDVGNFPGDIQVGAWVSVENLSAAAAIAYIHFFDDSKVDIGGATAWGIVSANQPEFKQKTQTIKRVDLPVGCRYMALKFSITGAPGITYGDAWIDGVQVVAGDFLPAWTPNLLDEGTTLDSIADGVSFGRVTVDALSGGNIDLASSGITNRGALALLNDVGNAQLKSDKSSLSKVTESMLDAHSTLNTIKLKFNKRLDTSQGMFLPKSFNDMPLVSEVLDGELFAVTGGGSPGIYIRNGAMAMNGAGTLKNFNTK